MVVPLPIPAPAYVDARSRALRTLAQGLAIDVATAVLLAIGPAVLGSGFAWTAAYWAALGLLAAKTAVQSMVAYFMRRLIPPATS